MKLYDAGRAPNPRRVRIFLAEKGISVPLVPVDLARFEHKTPEYRAINPLQRSPALVLDDGTVITESVAICRYFEETHPTPPLFGVGPVERALVEMWQRRIEFGLLNQVGFVFRHTHPGMAEFEVPQVATWGEVNRPRVLEFLDLLDEHLASREFICGDTYTIADITGLVGIDFMKPAKIAMPAHCAALARWHAAVSSRPSASA